MTCFPSGNSRQSWCWCGCSLLICRKIAVVCAIGCADQSSGDFFTGFANASSVLGKQHTAVLQTKFAETKPGSSGEANPRVPMPKFVVTRVSPTTAGRDATACKL